MRRNFMNTHNVTSMNVSDNGNDPFVVNIKKITELNNNFRTTLWTGTYMQLTLMSIEPENSIGLEVHSDTDQFLRIEQGFGRVMMGKNRDNLNYQQNVRDGFAVLVPAGTWHNILNIGKTPLKIYTIYAPPHHPRGTIHKTKADAEAAEKS